MAIFSIALDCCWHLHNDFSFNHQSCNNLLYIQYLQTMHLFDNLAAAEAKRDRHPMQLTEPNTATLASEPT